MIQFNLKPFVIVLTSISIHTSAFSQDWVVPDEAKAVVTSLPFSETTVQQGKDLFNANCKSCHGAIGTNAPLALTPSPGDPASERFASQTDGSLYFKITNGRVAMPSFKNTLSDNDRWAVISYIRTFHPNYQATNTAATEGSGDSFKGKGIQMSVDFDEATHTASVNLKGTQDGVLVSAKGVRVGAFVKRYFGLLAIGEPVKTNGQGMAKFEFPTDLPGDSTGQYHVVFKLIDEDVFGLVQAEQDVKWGHSFIYQNPLDQNALWGNRTAVPTWLLLSYFGVVGFVFSVIAWVVLQLLRLRKLS